MEDRVLQLQRIASILHLPSSIFRQGTHTVGAKNMAAEQKPVQIMADPSLSSPRIYSNYVQVSASPMDCTLTFCEVIGPQNEQEALKIQRTGTLPCPVKAVLVIPNHIVEGLI